MDGRSQQYDRQLRLWGGAGQSALERARVCVAVGAGGGLAAATEALKALALAGVGALTVVDAATAAAADLAANFFLEAQSVGRGRAHELVRLLLELNPEVRGYAVPEPVHLLLADRPDFWADFDAVLACGLPERTLAELSRRLWDANIPLLVCRSVGFLSCVRLQVKEHYAIETHPDNLPPDLRLHTPFPTLVEYVDSFDLDNMEFKDHAHVPWLVVLYTALQTWTRAHDGRWPLSYRDKEQVREIIRAGIKRDENGVPLDEENFQEAIRAVNGSVIQTTLPKPIKDILYDDACINLTQKSSPFWIMCSAIRSFVEEDGAGALPLRGSIPDMTAATQHYVKLQNVYRQKAAADAESVYRRVLQLVAELSVESISETDVKLICKHSSSLHVIRGSCIYDEYQVGSPISSCIARHLEEPNPMMIHYVLLRGAERFYSEQCRAPGEWDPETDIVKLKTCVTKLLGEWSCPPLAEDDYVHEMCRYGGSELHSVSAFMGGCVAQEIIKLITRQYIPINNFFIHEAMTCNSATFTF
ncbi:nedd8-activating enzyme E1 regulatory subunit APP-BP1 [Arctopsyche grandis]|uniref:nedd8-activating enzyme E1 regulatory subunit APP-BP1 n=1 Tax=Arctopsyche grandis TaxID=121162 RepID=UPI00406D81ED